MRRGGRNVTFPCGATGTALRPLLNGNRIDVPLRKEGGKEWLSSCVAEKKNSVGALTMMGGKKVRARDETLFFLYPARKSASPPSGRGLIRVAWWRKEGSDQEGSKCNQDDEAEIAILPGPYESGLRAFFVA